MSVLNRIAYFQNRRNEVPNQQLARELAETKDGEGIREIAENLWNKNSSIQSDCVKVLYEIGYIDPDLIADYVDDFLRLLKSRNNRMVWGGMIALATIAEKTPREIWDKRDDVIGATRHGSLITVVWGVRTLAKVASADIRYRERIFPILIERLRHCVPRDVPLHAESILCAVDETNREEFLSVLDSRRDEMKPSQLARLRKVVKALDTRQGS